mgnify:CR=1 FL=1
MHNVDDAYHSDSKKDLSVSISFESINYTSKIERAKRDKERWLRVLENREKIAIDKLT